MERIDSSKLAAISKESQSSSRLLSLDILRTIACCLVIVFHIDIPDDASNVIHMMNRGGWIGVDLFFVLSGFLVSGLLFQEFLRHGEINTRRFLIRRALKIYPAFYFFLLAPFALGAIMQLQGMPSARRLIPEIFFVQNYFVGIWGHCWSLAVEEHFYIGVAVLTSVLTHRFKHEPFRYIPIILVALSVITLGLRIHNSRSSFSLMTHHYPTHLRADSLGFGVLLSFLWNFHHDSFSAFCRRFRWLMLAFGVALLLPPFLCELGTNVFLHTFGFTAIYVGSGLIMMTLIVSDIPTNRLSQTIAKVGTYSYSIYLWHTYAIVMTQGVLASIGFANSEVTILLCILASISLGIVTAEVVEVPVLRLRNRFFPSSR